MALIDLYDAHHADTDLWRQVAGACIVAANDIENEDPGTGNHTNRLIWASQAKISPKGKAIEMLSEVLNNTTVRDSLPVALDTDVQFVVNSLVDTYATG